MPYLCEFTEADLDRPPSERNRTPEPLLARVVGFSFARGGAHVSIGNLQTLAAAVIAF